MSSRRELEELWRSPPEELSAGTPPPVASSPDYRSLEGSGGQYPRPPIADEYGEEDPREELFGSASLEDGSQPFADEDLGEDAEPYGYGYPDPATPLRGRGGEGVDFGALVERRLNPGVRRRLDESRRTPPSGFTSQASPPPRKTILLIGDVMPPPIRKPFVIPKPEPPKPPPGRYSGPIKFGSRVEFMADDFVRGITADLKPTGFSVINLATGRKRKYKYSDVHDRKIAPLPQQYVSKKGKLHHVHVAGVDLSVGDDKRRWADSAEDKEMTPGILIEFRTPVVTRGIVLGFTDKGFRISGEDGKTYKVSYDDPAIKEIPRKKTVRKISTRKIPTANETLTGDVTKEMRNLVVSRLFEYFAEIIPGVQESLLEVDPSLRLSTEELDVLHHGIKPWGLPRAKVVWRPSSTGEKRDPPGWLVKWSFQDTPLTEFFPVLPWMDKAAVKAQAAAYAANNYIDENFLSWRFARHHDRLRDEMPDLSPQVAEEVHLLSDPTMLLLGLKARYGDDIFDLDGLELKRRLADNRQGVEIIDVEIQRSLERLGFEELEKLKGRNLAVELSRIIASYQRRFPPKEDWIRANIERRWVWNVFMELKFTEGEWKDFEYAERDRLAQLYADHLKRYRAAQAHAAEIHAKRSALLAQHEARKEKVRALRAEKPRGAVQIRSAAIQNISEVGFQLLLDTEEFERDCLAGAGGEGARAFDYLVNIAKVAVFVTSTKTQLTKSAKFLHAKLAAGEIRVSALYAATLPYLFPELAMNFNALSDSEWETALGLVTQEIIKFVYDIADTLVSLQNVTTRRPTRQSRMFAFGGIERYLTSVIGKCEKDTKSGRRHVLDSSGEIKYQKVNVAGPYARKKKWQMQPVTEDIPLADVVICYDVNSDVFTCHSIDEVLRAIRRDPKAPMNPYTHKVYPEAFVKKMQARYPERLREVSLELTPIPDPPWTPTPSPATPSPRTPTPSPVGEDEPTTIEELKEMMPEGGLTVVYFCALWRKPCQRFEEKWDALKKENSGEDVTFLRVNLDEDENIAKTYSLKKTPSFLIARRKGDKITKHATVTGSDQSKIQAAITNHL